MVASATMFAVDSSHGSLIREEPPVSRSTTPDRLPRWMSEQSELELLERACLSEDALWSRLGNWDL
jgi:hypothetical protein